MKKLLRLWVMTKLNYSDEYVKGAIKSSDTDIKNLTHNQLAVYRTILRQIEADLMIELAFENSKTKVSDIDTTVFKPVTKVF